MKNYFSFNLTGKKYLPIWILFLICFMVPYGVLIFSMKNIQHGDSPSLIFFPLILLIIIVAFAFSFYTTKLTIENVFYKDQPIVFSGTFGIFIGKVLLGLFLTIITLGIYMAWFLADLQKFFTNNSSFNQENFEFKGKAGKLFVILLLTMFVPVIILTIIMSVFIVSNKDNAPMFILISQMMMFIILIPYMYYVYKWIVNIRYKDYSITWHTEFWPSCGKIALEILLSFITLGIFFPLAMLRLYTYFAPKTHAVSDENTLTFGYDIDPLNDFLFIWGQILLTIITLSIYYPWAFCKTRSRILSKTYLIQN